MAGGDPHPPRPPQEDVEKLPSLSFAPPLAGNSPTLSTFIGKHKIHINATIIPDQQPSNPFSVVGLRLTDLGTRINQLQTPSFFQGKPKVTFQKSDKKKLIDGLQHVLIAKCSHGRPKIADFKLFLAKQKPKGKFHVSIFDSKHLFVVCEKFEDFAKIWIKQFWIINGFKIRIFKWTENFDPCKESTVFPVWIHLPRLPLYLFNEGALMLIGNAIGRPLFIDKANISKDKVSYATLCVEMDVLSSPAKDIWIQFEDVPSTENAIGSYEGFLQEVVYNFIPPFCSSCHHLGHRNSSCKRNLLSNDGKEPLFQLASKVPKVLEMQDNSEEEGEFRPSTDHLEMGTNTSCIPVEKRVMVTKLQDKQELKGKNCSGSVLATNFNNSEKQSNASLPCILRGGSGTSSSVVRPGNPSFLESKQAVYKHPGQQKPDGLSTYGNTNGGLQVDENVKGRTQVAGMLVNKWVVSDAVNCHATKRQNKIYQAKKQTSISSESWLTSKNSFAILEDNVLLEDLTSKEGELVDVAGLETGITREVNRISTPSTEERVFNEVVCLEEGGIADMVDAAAVSPQKSSGAAVSSGNAPLVTVVCDPVPAKSAQQPAAAMTDPAVATEKLDQEIEKPDCIEQVESTDPAAGSDFGDDPAHGERTSGERESLTFAAIDANSARQACPEIDTEQVTYVADSNRSSIKHNGGLEFCTVEEQLKVLNTVEEHTDTADAQSGHMGVKSSLLGHDAADSSAIGSKKKGLACPDSLKASGNRGGTDDMDAGSYSRNIHTASITPRKLSSAAAKFTPKWAVLVEELVEDKKQSDHVLVEKEVEQIMITNNDMEQLQERMNRLKGNSFSAAPSLAASTWFPPNMSKHLARELKKTRKQLRINQNWQDIEDYSDEESDEGDLEEKAGSQMMNGNAILTDEMGDIPRPFKIKSAPNSPKGRNSSYDSSTYLLSRGLF